MPRSALVLAVVLAVAIAVGGVFALTTGPAAEDAASGCGSGEVGLTVVAAPRLAGAVTAAASTLAGAPAGGPCVRVSVVSRPSRQVADELTGVTAPAAGAAPPDVWVPESSSWLDLVRLVDAGARALPPAATVIASSPVVIAMPEPMARALGWPQRQPNWRGLTVYPTEAGFWARHGHPEWGGFRLALADPGESTAAAHGLLAAVAAAADRPTTAIAAEELRASPDLRGWLRFLDQHSDQVAAPDAVLAGLRAADAAGQATSHLSATVLPECEVIAYNQGRAAGGSTGAPAVRLVAGYPADGRTVLERVPFAILPAAADDEGRAGAALALLDALRAEPGLRALADAGYRPPDGTAAGPAFGPDTGVLAELPRTLGELPAGPLLDQARRTFADVRQQGA
ncbi:MAG: substrate-binding domain-containing protein [Frankia sp.]|nr:substrate-binding domain-containing protein [Frankia sp.]